MGATFEESVFDFDLNFLQHSSNSVNDNRIDKQRKAIIVAKKKTIATDQLIKKYYAKKEQFEQNEVVLLAAKEECKQVCLDYKVSLEKCADLEKDVKVLENKQQDLEKNFEFTKNQLEAINSHAHQLQMLTRDHETLIESLKIESQLDKTNLKEFENKLIALKRENEMLISDLCLARDIAMGKKKLSKHHKKLLLKYDNEKYINKEGESSLESSDEETEFFDSTPASPLYTSLEANSSNKNETTIKLNENGVCNKKDSIRITEDHDSDYSNEIVSEDTGRGSSLAFSDGDKCFNSPDYFSNDSPFASDCNRVKEKRTFIDACNSPITVSESVDIATSPCMFDDVALLSDNINTPIEKDSSSKEWYITDIPLSTENVIIKENKKTVDVGINTTKDQDKVNVSTSPVQFGECYHKQVTNTASSPIFHIQNFDIDTIHTTKDITKKKLHDEVTNQSIENKLSLIDKGQVTIQNLSSQCEIEITSKSHERNCLEINSKNIDSSENNCDEEIEMILSTMRLPTRLISPIPTTPVKLRKDMHKHSPIKQTSKLPKEHTVCPEAAQLREDNRALQTSIAELTKEVMDIKSLLKKHHILPASPKKHKSVDKKIQSKMSLLFDDSDEETMVLNNDNNCSPVKANIPLNDPDELTELPRETVENNELPEIVIPNNEILSSDSPSPRRNIVDLPDELVEQSKEIDTLTTNKPTLEADINITNENIPRIESCKTIDKKLSLEDDIESNLYKPEDNGKEILSIENKLKKFKPSKLSRLDKFRNKLKPKSKIQRMHVPIRKLRSKHKIKPLKNVNATGAETILKNKSVYEKALKVMTEIKLKKKFDIKNGSKAKEAHDIIEENKKSQQNESVNLSNSNISEKLSPKTKNIEIRQPIVCLSQMNWKEILHKERERKNSQNLSPKKSEETVPHKNSSPVKNIVTSGNLKNNVQGREALCISPRKSKDTVSNNDSPAKNIIITRNRSKKNQDPDTNVDVSESELDKPLERRKRVASDNSPIECKRVLRSHHVIESIIDHDKNNETNNNLKSEECKTLPTRKIEKVNQNHNIFNTEINTSSVTTALDQTVEQTSISTELNHPKNSILCKMLEKYGKAKVKFIAKKVPDAASDTICKKLEDNIAKIIELPIGDKANIAMNNLVEEIQHSWNIKYFLTGFMKYLKDPARKRELFNKQSTPPAPSMTKSEQVLLYVIRQLEISLPKTVDTILNQIEFSLFQLNRTPEFDIIESLSHFYALLCRYFGFKNRLRLFLLDAMYCLQFKVVPLIKQCLDVWMHILPLAHMGIAKSPLVTCLVYLLHFYKCEDRFNRVQDIRYILNRKYFYQITDWNETKILEMFRNSIQELRDIKIERKMLRMSFIILAKRQGPKWCQKNIIKNMLIPFIENEEVPLKIKQFCVELLGPILKPYPINMKVHCEIIVNQLLDLLNPSTPDSMKESIFTSLIYMNKHNQNRVTQSLLSWTPKRVSTDFEELMRDFIREKPFHVWKKVLSRTPL